MQFESFKKWLPFALIAMPLLWLGLYAWAWMARHGCPTLQWGECWVSAATGWGADVVMFRWVDTTLGAGFLAFAGGTFVYVAARQQRREQLADRYQATRELRLGLLSEIRRQLIALGDMGLQMGSTSGLFASSPEASMLKTARERLQALDAAVANTVPFAPTLAHIISNLSNAVQAALDGAHFGSSTQAWTQLKRALRNAGTAAGYFTPTDRLIDAEGHFVHRPKKTDRAIVDMPNALHWLFEFG